MYRKPPEAQLHKDGPPNQFHRISFHESYDRKPNPSLTPRDLMGNVCVHNEDPVSHPNPADTQLGALRDPKPPAKLLGEDVTVNMCCDSIPPLVLVQDDAAKVYLGGHASDIAQQLLLKLGQQMCILPVDVLTPFRPQNVSRNA